MSLLKLTTPHRFAKSITSRIARVVIPDSNRDNILLSERIAKRVVITAFTVTERKRSVFAGEVKAM